MRTVSATSGVEVLDADACRGLLSDDVIGRLGVVIGRRPVVVPVNYVFDGESIVLRTMPGSKIDVGQGPAAFEVDGFDRATKSGWSVLVSGDLAEVTELDPEWRHVTSLPVEPWAGGERPAWLRLRPAYITGRVVPVATIGDGS